MFFLKKPLAAHLSGSGPTPENLPTSDALLSCACTCVHARSVLFWNLGGLEYAFCLLSVLREMHMIVCCCTKCAERAERKAEGMTCWVCLSAAILEVH